MKMRQMTALALAATGCLAGPAQATTYTVLFASSGQAASPTVGLVRRHTIYGTDPATGNGTLFQLDSAGTYTTLHAFSGADGSAPNARLAMDKQGDIYGTTASGGGANVGTVFKLAPSTQALATLYSFAGSPDGAVPRDGLAMDGAGLLYGTASEGDLSPGNGEIFSITQSGTMHVVYQFLSGADGHCPFTGVILGGGGRLFGTTVGLGFGGQSQGSVFEFRLPKAVVKTIYAFTDGTDGEYPQITPTRDHRGHLYGVSNEQNGQTYAGALWTITRSGFSILHGFTGGADGYMPNGPLALGRDGMLYGTTYAGGSATGPSGYGTVFRISSAGVLQTLHTFMGGADGAWPTGSLAFDTAGNVYGGTSTGLIFEITP